MVIRCLWLGTILKKEEFKDAEEYLNNLLSIKSIKTTTTRKVKGLSIVYFNIEEDSEVKILALKRLNTNDIKWESDYPQYTLK